MVIQTLAGIYTKNTKSIGSVTMKIFNEKNDLNQRIYFKMKKLNPDKFDEIDSLCQNFSQKTNLTHIIKDFNINTKMKGVSPSTYLFDNYKIILGTRDNITEYLDNLLLLKKYNISSCPQLDRVINNKNSQYSMLVLKTPEKEILMKDYADNKNSANIISKCKFLSELERLAKKSEMYNPVLSNENNIKLTSKGELFVDDWSYLEKFSNEQEKQEYFNQLKKLLNLVLV